MRRWRAWFAADQRRGDALLALLLSPFTFLATVGIGAERGAVHGLVGVSLGLAFTLPVVWRRARPDAAVAVLVGAHLVQLWWTDWLMPANVVAPVAVHAAAAWSPPRWARGWLAVAVVGSLLAGVDWGTSRGLKTVDVAAWTVACLLVTLVAWFWGEVTRQRRLTLESLQQRADALERERDRDRLLAIEEERTRIAREMHDVVAHALAIIVVQADGARYLAAELAEGDPRAAAVGEAVETIGSTARAALTETRQLVGALRQGEDAELAPAAGLAQVPALVESLVAGGVDARLELSGSPAAHPPLGAGAELAAYRVVQEGLTNVLKHAGPGARVTVTLHHDADGLDLAVADTGRGPGLRGPDGGGHGLIGMRERMAAWGGTLITRPREGGGFEVLAHLPAPVPQEERR